MIEIDAKKESSTLGKSIGLIGKGKPYALFFRTRWGIHTFGVRFPIDVVILDETMKIQTIKKNLKPNRVFFWNPAYRNVLELPGLTIDKENISIGMRIKIAY